MQNDMFSLDLFHDLFRHMEWADATIWNAVAHTPAAEGNGELHKRMFHMHGTQKAFLQVWKGEEVERVKPDSYPTLKSLYEWIQSYYTELTAYLNEIDEEQLNNSMPVPWAGYFGRRLGREVEVTTLGETLFQVTSHSVHHRGQVNMQLRQLGGEPPLIDYIAWLWMSRPAAEWKGI